MCAVLLSLGMLYTQLIYPDGLYTDVVDCNRRLSELFAKCLGFNLLEDFKNLYHFAFRKDAATKLFDLRNHNLF